MQAWTTAAIASSIIEFKTNIWLRHIVRGLGWSTTPPMGTVAGGSLTGGHRFVLKEGLFCIEWVLQTTAMLDLLLLLLLLLLVQLGLNLSLLLLVQCGNCSRSEGSHREARWVGIVSAGEPGSESRSWEKRSCGCRCSSSLVGSIQIQLVRRYVGGMGLLLMLTIKMIILLRVMGL